MISRCLVGSMKMVYFLLSQWDICLFWKSLLFLAYCPVPYRQKLSWPLKVQVQEQVLLRFQCEGNAWVVPNPAVSACRGPEAIGRKESEPLLSWSVQAWHQFYLSTLGSSGYLHSSPSLKCVKFFLDQSHFHTVLYSISVFPSVIYPKWRIIYRQAAIFFLFSHNVIPLSPSPR